MKSLAELQAIRDKAKAEVEQRKDHHGYKVVVGMATCGIAAGARPVMSTLLEAVEKSKLDNVIVTQTGCIGVCRLEPIVEVFNPDGSKATYVKMNSEKAKKMFEQHIKHGTTVTEYTIGYEEQQNQ